MTSQEFFRRARALGLTLDPAVRPCEGAIAAVHRRVPDNAFEGAAYNLLLRYYRRHPLAGRTYDLTNVKDRWYRRGSCAQVRGRLGGTRSLAPA